MTKITYFLIDTDSTLFFKSSSFVINHVTMFVQVCFLTFYSVLLVLFVCHILFLIYIIL